jgi:hypothetical protein
VSFQPGSFRDPDSRVVIEDGRVFRDLAPRGVEEYEAFAASKLAQDARIVATERVGPARLEHELIPFVSYPYEWTFGMLKAAALLTLELIDDAIGEGLMLKDATPYNVQFVGARPVFVDVGSFECLRSGEPWPGYRQFCTLFLYPLMLSAYRGVPFQPWLKGSLEGIEPADAAALLPRRRGVTVNARLLARLEARAGGGGKTPRVRPEVIRATVRKLSRLIARLEWDAATEWSVYERNYTAADLASKEEFVGGVGGRVTPSLTWDLGANDGRFSRLVPGRVIAMDADPGAAEGLFRSLRDEAILPLVVDVCDSSPARGWALREREPLLSRGRPDLTLSLALVHHLCITRNVPLPEIVAWLASLGGTHVIEFPHRDDPRVQQLLAAKRPGDTRPDYDIEPFEAALRGSSRVLSHTRGSTRSLYEVEVR